MLINLSITFIKINQILKEKEKCRKMVIYLLFKKWLKLMNKVSLFQEN